MAVLDDIPGFPPAAPHSSGSDGEPAIRRLERFFSRIREGDVEGILAMRNSIWREAPVETSWLELKKIEYRTAIQIAMMGRAAMDSGVDEARVLEEMDGFYRRIAGAAAAEDFLKICTDATLLFVGAIREIISETAPSIHVDRCKEYIRRNLNVNFTLEDAAAELGVTPSYLTHIFSAQEHRTMREYILRERVEASKSLLQNPDYSIAQIASHFCFCSQSHFSAVFKKYCGCTPSVYRKQLLRKEREGI